VGSDEAVSASVTQGKRMTKCNPYLDSAGNTEEASSFYKSVFGGEFASVVRFRDMPMAGASPTEEDADKILHIGLPFGQDQMLMASDVLESLGQRPIQGNNVYISVHPDSKQEADRLLSALSEGAEIEMAIADQPWGDYWGSLKDKHHLPLGDTSSNRSKQQLGVAC
jgi:PhnB protein